MKTFLSLFVSMLLTVPAGLCQAAENINVKNGIRFTIATEREKYSVEDPVMVNMEFKNVSDKKINFFFNTCPVEFLRLFVYDAQGKEIFAQNAKHLIPCRAATSQLLKLEPGQMQTTSVNIAQVIKKKVVENGIFQIVFTYSVPDDWKDIGGIGDNYWKWTVQSNIKPLTFIKTYSVTEITDSSTKGKITAKLRSLFKDPSIQVTTIEELDDIKVFAQYRLLRIYVRPNTTLEHIVLPDGPSFGMFAYNADELLYLNRSNNNFETILWNEKRINAKKVSPSALAKALLLCKISEKQISNHLITNIKDVFDYEKKSGILQGYKAHRGNLLKFKKDIVKPKWVDSGITHDLIFFALSGWMHKITNLVEIKASFDKASSGLTISQVVLEDEIFKKTPDISY